MGRTAGKLLSVSSTSPLRGHTRARAHGPGERAPVPYRQEVGL